MDILCSCDHALMSSGRLFKAHIGDSPFDPGSYTCSGDGMLQIYVHLRYTML